METTMSNRNRSFTISMSTGEVLDEPGDERAALEAPGAFEEGTGSGFGDHRMAVVDGRDFLDVAPQLMERFYGHPAGYRGFDGGGQPNGAVLMGLLSKGRSEIEPPCVYVSGDAGEGTSLLLN
jgi:hypothetical protein